MKRHRTLWTNVINTKLTLLDLPVEVIIHVFCLLDRPSRCNTRLSCHKLKTIMDSPVIWKNMVVQIRMSKHFSVSLSVNDLHLWQLLRIRNISHVSIKPDMESVPKVHILEKIVRHSSALKSIETICYFARYLFTEQKPFLSKMKDTLEHVTIDYLYHPCFCQPVYCCLGHLKNIPHLRSITIFATADAPHNWEECKLRKKNSYAIIKTYLQDLNCNVVKFINL